ncbi:hypothetical protein [Chthoniobacter flavus]|uniref:hypothetical protein n=1 Tax=Chthoniobacter flavus TaxID=191863 RepID=UPI0003179274|nr:hypothetical protein [Chthoniobacter flavus]
MATCVSSIAKRPRISIFPPRGDLLSLYHEYRLAHEAQLTALCQQRSGKFLSISSAEPLERVVFDIMRRRGWIV